MNDYQQGQIDLIQFLKKEISRFEKDQSEGINLALDIVFLLKNLKPLEPRN